MTPPALAAFLLALGVTFLATPVARALALKMRFVDHPSDRKLHSNPVPYLGGLAIIFAFFSVVAIGAVTQSSSDPAMARTKLAAILGGGLALGAMGLWDDLKVVPGWIKVPVELGLAALLYFSGAKVELTGFQPVDFLLTVGWVIGITNAANYMDNMDGLSGGIVAIAGTLFWFLADFSGQLFVGALSAALAGCAAGYLWYNRPPARIYMGDTGSLFFGFLLAGLGLELRFENLGSSSFLVPVAIMAVPILDALLVSVSRTMRGLSPIHPGKDHLSHRLVGLGLSPWTAVRLLWLVSSGCGAMAILIAHSPPFTAYLMMSTVVLGAAVTAFVLLRLERKSIAAGTPPGIF